MRKCLPVIPQSAFQSSTKVAIMLPLHFAWPKLKCVSHLGPASQCLVCVSFDLVRMFSDWLVCIPSDGLVIGHLKKWDIETEISPLHTIPVDFHSDSSQTIVHWGRAEVSLGTRTSPSHPHSHSPHTHAWQSCKCTTDHASGQTEPRSIIM